MSGTRLYLGGLAAAFLGLGLVRGEGPGHLPAPPAGGQPAEETIPIPPPNDRAEGPPAFNVTKPPPGPAEGAPAGAEVDGAMAPTGAGTPGAGPSPWVLYPRPPGCCGPMGSHGPIVSEVYLRTGLSFPVGGGLLHTVLHTGWGVEGGGRALFFDPAMDRAWTVDLGISNFSYHSSDREHVVVLHNVRERGTNPLTGQTTTQIVPEVSVTVRALNQTAAYVALGREYYLVGNGDCTVDGMVWRAGWDVGGRWGSQKLSLNEIQHRVGVFRGLFGAVHTDLEVPCESCIFQAGVRLEYGYNWSSILQDFGGDLATINLMFTAGIRF
jgi:hypothetical protein